MAVQRTLRVLRLCARAAPGPAPPGPTPGPTPGPAPGLVPPPGACGGLAAPPPCAPCGARPAPPCRAGRAPPPRGVRVACCPARRAPPPPCAAARCSLTCGDVTKQKDDVPRSDTIVHKSKDSDCVSWKLQCAKHVRQVDYEREVSSRKAPCAAETPPAPYQLGGERELALATDGNLYAISNSDAPQTGFSSSGHPPPPRLVSLEPTNSACAIGDDHLDPCAHQPRVFLEIDRRSTENAKKTEYSEMKTSGSNDPHGKGTEGGAVSVGDYGWCKNPPTFPGAPKRCRPPTVAERLRARPSRLLPPKPSDKGTRCLHTSITARSAGDKLQELLKAREQLHEAGRGRVVTGDCSPKPRVSKPLEGKLDMCVPPGASRVRVRVCLDGDDCGSSGNEQRRVTSDQRRHCQIKDIGSSCKSVSWLSMKGIQNKFSGCPDAKVAPSSKENPRKCEPPCAPCPAPPGAGAPPPRPSCGPRPASPCGPASRRASSSICIANSVVTAPF